MTVDTKYAAGSTSTSEIPVGMNEAARHLGLSRRTLTDVIKRHPYFSRGGRANVFYVEDLAKLRQALRNETLKKNKHIHERVDVPLPDVSLEHVMKMLTDKKSARKKGRRRNSHVR